MTLFYGPKPAVSSMGDALDMPAAAYQSMAVREVEGKYNGFAGNRELGPVSI